MAEVDRRLRTFEENARFMAEFNKFQGLKETKRRLTLQQKDPSWKAALREAGSLAFLALFACVGAVSRTVLLVTFLEWAFLPEYANMSLVEMAPRAAEPLKELLQLPLGVYAVCVWVGSRGGDCTVVIKMIDRSQI